MTAMKTKGQEWTSEPTAYKANKLQKEKQYLEEKKVL